MSRAPRKIEEVFPNLALSADLRVASANWQVESVSFEEEEQTLHVLLASPRIIAPGQIARLREEFKRQLFPQEEITVRIDERYALDGENSAEHILKAYRENILDELKQKGDLQASLFRSAGLEFPAPDQLLLTLPDSILARRRGEELAAFLIRLLRERFGVCISISQDFDGELPALREEGTVNTEPWEEEIRETISSVQSGESPDKSVLPGVEDRGEVVYTVETKKRATRSGRRVRARVGSGSRDVLYNRDFSGSAIPIAEINEATQDIVVQGEIIYLETREIKPKSRDNLLTMVLFHITDDTDTIQGKIFLDPEDWKVLGEQFKTGSFVKIRGRIDYDTYAGEIGFSYIQGIKKAENFRDIRRDEAGQKRVELHCHTKMSDMDGVADVADLIARAYAWGHPAIAITDHGGVQAFPEAQKAVKKMDRAFVDAYREEHPGASEEELTGLHAPFKVIYGCEVYLVDDERGVATGSRGQSLDGRFVVFDIETTGLSNQTCRIIEIGAVCVEQGEIVGRFSTFVNPGQSIPLHIEELTGISDKMVADTPGIEVVLPEFLEFCRGAVLVAHNADFDMGFIRRESERLGLPCDFTYVDTVATARYLLPHLSRFRLETVAKAVGAELLHHHRAVDDAACTADIFLKFIDRLSAQGIHDLDALNRAASGSEHAIRKAPARHAILLAQNETGRRNLYRLISESHLRFISSERGAPRAKLPKSLLAANREGILVGTACEAGELFQSLLAGATDAEIARIVDFYDYLEIQPISNNRFLLRKEDSPVTSEEDLRGLNRRIVSLGEQFDKPVVATGDAHYVDPQDEIYRRIILAGKKFKDADEKGELYFRTTDEMLEEFSYLGEEKAREVVVTNPNRIADLCERISPLRSGEFPPVIENAESDLREICLARAHELYGDPLPEVVEKRLERELNSIISNGYAGLYIVAQKLVAKANEDGYLVGSRGSVGSSFVATVAGITEVNPLPPHYICPHCRTVDFDSPEVRAAARDALAGVDLSEKTCPNCGAPMDKVGYNIPFETFLGFMGNKEPDIDLNFSGEYQSRAHKYTEEIFGEGQTFRAGTIGKMAEKTAYGYVKNYYEERGEHKRGCEIDRIVRGLVGVRRTTGQHPGGIVVLPVGEDINSFTPVQHPADDMSTDIVTTHFDYDSIKGTLLKLDILGHDDPTMIRYLQTLTGTDPLQIPLDEPAVMTLFQGTEALGIAPEDIGGCPLGCLGVPEFGTNNVIDMLVETKPKNFSDLIRISGLSHGTNVWHGNAQDLIKEGTCTLAEAICTRDDIMTYLIGRGLESELSFEIMESVRHGDGLKPEWEEAMRGQNVPDWYIESCKHIEYMFPKAHAVAYVMMGYRIAWYKIYYPLAYYAAYFSIRASGFDYEMMCQGRERLEEYMRDYKERWEDLTNQEKEAYRDMRLVQEMYARGFDFLPLDIYRAKAHRFQIIDGALMPALDAIEGLGDKAADAVEAAALEGAFLSKDDLRRRTKVSKTVIETLDRLGVLRDLPETDQITLFDL